MDNKKNRYRIEKSFATAGRAIVRERKVNTEGGQTNRICLCTLRQLLRSSWEVSEAHNEMKHAFINAQSNATFSPEACVASCIYNRHLTVTRVLGANIHDTRQDGSKRSRQEQTNTRGETKESDYAYINAQYAPRAHWKNQRARTAKGSLLTITPASTAIKSRAN